ncbi:MAG: M1 family metallopeptidase [Kofleriaceae bacterium]|nr:M1 family metallopeptidase [Kofleriaceae bacterium]
MCTRAIAALALLVTGACYKAGPSGTLRDPHSFSEPDRVAVKSLALDLAVDFATKTLTGTARLEVQRTDPKAPLVLDSNGLVITAVSDCAGAALTYRVGDHTPIGEPVKIDLESDCAEVAYHTAPDAGALMWVEPAGTAGGVQPMLFTQSQAIYARTWIPLQDSPSVRFTYSATIRTPKGMWALMSAENPQALVPDGVWTFKQPKAVPSYLMALAVGDFAFKPIGPRTGVYAEPSMVDKAAYEFAEVEQMIDAAEKLYGPYRWGRYDMLVLPPSFPIGGMENPNLTFVTPTVINGDRALVSMIAHELAHSWSGNLVTNKTWNDLWLNEGFTTYVERRIMEQLRGREHADVDWYIGTKDIEEYLKARGRDGHASRLSTAYGRGSDPDQMSSDLAYDKGALFLRTLEQAYGRDKFDAFLRGWFERHAFSSADSKMFETEVKAELGSASIDLEEWLYKPGLPAHTALTGSQRAAQLEAKADAFAKDGTPIDAAGWGTMDWVVFLRELPENASPARLAELDKEYRLTATTNAEIATHWLPRLVAADARDAVPAIEQFLLRVGRRRMVWPLYVAMANKNEFWREQARAIFKRAKPKYHVITSGDVEKLLAPPRVRPVF